MPGKQKITTFLWFDGDAEAAVGHYLSVFPDSRLVGASRAGEGGPWFSASFELAGQPFLALNVPGRPAKFTEAISLLVRCESQAEIDELWEELGAGGEPGRCGWLKDRWGLSWQVIPSILGDMLQDEDPHRVQRVGEAMMQMGKLDIARLQQAYDRE